MNSQASIIRDLKNLVASLETPDLRMYHRETQTDVTIRDKYSTDPKLLLNEAFDEFFNRMYDVTIHESDLPVIKHCFPDKDLLMEYTGSIPLNYLLESYVDKLRRKDGLSTWRARWNSREMVVIRIPDLCKILKKRTPLFNSTLPDVWWKVARNEHYSFDIVRELKFFRQTLNGLNFDVTPYYLFLESEGIPISQILAHPHVKAQVGIDFNVYHHCPELEKFMDSPIFQRLLIAAECLSSDVVEKIKTRIVSIAAIIYNLSRWSMSKLTTTDLVVNLTALLSICVPISVMTEFFGRIFSPLAQSSEESKIRTILKAFFLGLFVLVVGKLPGKHTIDEFINRVHKFPQAFESIQKFWKQIDPITIQATNYIESELLGYDVIAEKTIMDEVQQWANLVEEYSDLYKKREIAKDKRTMLTAGRIHVDGVRLLSKCLRLHYSRENVELIRSLLPTTYKISEIAIRSGADHSKPRREPLIVWFCGKSGVGKSTLTYPFLCDMMKSELGPGEELPDNWVQKIYARAPECEYFDGDPTDWMVYDDGFQIRDSVANPSPELFEIIRLGNMFPYMYHKASIEEKGNCFADVKGIVISSNIERIMAESIHCPEAVARRIKYAYKVLLKPQYRLYYTGKDGQRTYRLDKTKIDAPNMDIYQFQPFDPLTGDKFGHPLTYQDMLLQCAVALRQLGDEFISYEKWLEDYRKVPFTKSVAQVGAINRRSERVIHALMKLKRDEYLTNEDVLALQWVFGSERNIERYGTMIGKLDISFLRIKFNMQQMPVEVFEGPQFDDATWEEFYMELRENKFLAKVRETPEGLVNQVLLDNSCELIRPFRFFRPDMAIARTLIGLWQHGERAETDFCRLWAQSISEDWQAITTDPIRSFASGAFQTLKSCTYIPAICDALLQRYTGLEILPNDPTLKTYRQYFQNELNALVRFEYANCVFRTSFPYVQSGPVIEEVTEADVNSVRAKIQRYRMRVKKIAKDAWAYTCAHWPNMLLYSIGAVSATYSLYNIFRNVQDSDLGEEFDCRAQSLDESGSKTQPRPRARVQHEDRSSGPHPNTRIRPRVQNTDVSGPSSVQRKPHARVQAQLEADLRPEWSKPIAQGNTSSAIDHQLYSILDSRVYANTLMAYITPSEQDTIQRRLGHIIALRGSLFMMNYHFVLVLKEYPMCDVVIRQGNCVYHRCSTKELVQNYVRVRDRDLVVFEMKRKGIAFCDLVKHIQTKAMSYSHNVQTVLLARQRLHGMSVTPNPVNSTDAYLSVSPISIELDMRGETTEIVNAESWLYTGVTNNGDCGALLLLSNNRVPAKIVGVHNAFDPYKCKAIAVPLYRDEIEETMAYFKPRLQYGWSEDFPLNVHSLNFDHGENFNVVRSEEGSIPTNCKSRLSRSPIFEELVPTKTKPGYLRPFVNAIGEVVDPARLARAKWGYHLPKQDEGMSQRATDAVVQVLMRKHRQGHPRYEYPLTTEEAIVGIEGVEGLNSINKTSSPGYPYIFNKVPGRGKTGYFGQYEFDLDKPEAQQVIREVQLMERDILNNKRPFVVWVDTLKDARIPIEKAERGKTRIFSAGPMAYTILYRKYFLPAIAHVMWNRIDNHIAVGINPTSPEWHTLALKLKSKGRYCVAGDYTCFDGKAPTEGYLSALEFFKAWYTQHWDKVVENHGNVIEKHEMTLEEFLDFLDKVFLEVVNHVHLTEYEIDGKKHHLFYSVCNGQPSGNPGTAMTNSAQGLWMMIRCWLELTKGTPMCTVSAFFEHVYMIDYGDDLAANISSAAISFFNQNTLTRVMKKLFDIDFTDEKKTGEVTPDFRTLSEITFLKRGFVFNEEIQLYVCPMEEEVLLDILNWVRTGSEDPRVITINNIASIAAELALISQEAFDRWMPRLREAYEKLAWRVEKQLYFDTRYGYLLAFRNANFKSVTPEL